MASRWARWWLLALTQWRAAEVANAVVFQRGGEKASSPRPLVRLEIGRDDGAPEPESLAALGNMDAFANTPVAHSAQPSDFSFDMSVAFQRTASEFDEHELLALFAEGNEAADTPEQSQKRKAAESALSTMITSGASSAVGMDSDISGIGMDSEPPPAKKVKTETAAPPAPPIKPGDVITDLPRPGKMTIIREIVKGGFATVFEADLDLGAPVKVAVKQDSGKQRAITLEAEFVFMQDFRKAAPGLALQVYFVDSQKGILVMQLAAFDMLEWIINADRHLAWDQRTRAEDVHCMMFGILKGIADMHHRGWAHRDIKPDNFMFVRGDSLPGKLRLAFSDFGFACAFGQTDNRELQDWRCTPAEKAGTRVFMPPELLKPGQKEATNPIAPTRQDVWAAGVVFAMLLDPQHVSDEFASQIHTNPNDYINEIVQRRPDLDSTPLGRTMQHVLRYLLEPDPINRCKAIDCLEMLKA